DLIRVDALIGVLAAGQFLDDLGHCGHAGGTTHEHHVVDVGHGDAGVLDDVVERHLGAVQQVGGHLLELGAGEALVEVDGPVLGHRQVLQGDVGGGGRGE